MQSTVITCLERCERQAAREVGPTAPFACEETISSMCLHLQELRIASGKPIIFIYTHIYIYVCIYMYVYICMYIYVYIVYMYTYVYIYVCIQIYVYTHTHTHTHAQTHTNTHTHTHTHSEQGETHTYQYADTHTVEHEHIYTTMRGRPVGLTCALGCTCRSTYIQVCAADLQVRTRARSAQQAQHTSACVSIRQHASAYVSIRQHT
jgi:hypothetical protein